MFRTQLAWQAWRLATSTFPSRGMRGTWPHPRALCVAGVPLMALDLVVRLVPIGRPRQFGWHLWHWPLVALDAAPLGVGGIHVPCV